MNGSEKHNKLLITAASNFINFYAFSETWKMELLLLGFTSLIVQCQSWDARVGR